MTLTAAREKAFSRRGFGIAQSHSMPFSHASPIYFFNGETLMQFPPPILGERRLCSDPPSKYDFHHIPKLKNALMVLYLFPKLRETSPVGRWRLWFFCFHSTNRSVWSLSNLIIGSNLCGPTLLKEAAIDD